MATSPRCARIDRTYGHGRHGARGRSPRGISQHSTRRGPGRHRARGGLDTERRRLLGADLDEGRGGRGYRQRRIGRRYHPHGHRPREGNGRHPSRGAHPEGPRHADRLHVEPRGARDRPQDRQDRILRLHRERLAAHTRFSPRSGWRSASTRPSVAFCSRRKS